MPQLIAAARRIPAAGTPPKNIDEFIGRANTQDTASSIARVRSPTGGREPGQTPGFDEYTLGLRAEHCGGVLAVAAGQAVIARAGERVRCSTPGAAGAAHIAICIPAFSPDTARRDPRLRVG